MSLVGQFFIHAHSSHTDWVQYRCGTSAVIVKLSLTAQLQQADSCTKIFLVAPGVVCFKSQFLNSIAPRELASVALPR